MCGALQIVVIGVLCQTSVHESPGQVVDGILLILNGLCDDLRTHVVVKEMVQVRLDRKGFVQEFLEKKLLWSVAKENAFAHIVYERPAYARG